MAIEATRRTFLIGGACTISLLSIGFAYVSSGPSLFSARHADAGSTRDLLVQYAAKDSDSDGLPDWQEDLYGTNPNNAHSVNPSVNDAEAVAKGLVQPRFKGATTSSADASSIPGVDTTPTTVTDQFAKQLFGQYLKTRGSEAPSASDVATFVENAVADLSRSQTLPDTYNLGQVHVSGTGPSALSSYAVRAENIIYKEEGNELEILAQAVNGDAKALAQVNKIGIAYGVAGKSLIQSNVPKELAPSHLALANALMRMSDGLKDVSLINSDPLAAMLGLGNYSKAFDESLRALAAMNAVYVSEGVAPGAGDPGVRFYTLTLIASGASKQ